MFTRTARFAFCKNGPAPNIPIPAGSNRTRSGCRLLAGREFAPNLRDRKFGGLEVGQASPHGESLFSAC